MTNSCSFDAYIWQTLENKLRFIRQILCGDVSVRQADDLEGGELTYAEIKAIASGNPAVMEKMKVDTEIRKLDTLKSAHLNQQHKIRSALSYLPGDITRSEERISNLRSDIAPRDKSAEGDFSMSVGNKTFTGKDARHEAAKALTHIVMSWRDDERMVPRATYRGFTIMSKGRGTPKLEGMEDRLPDLYVKGAALYNANLNAENPTGTMQSIEHVLRAIDGHAEKEAQQLAQLEKTQTDYRGQLDRPFEHEDKLKELLMRQAQLNAALDLDKSDKQATEVPSDDAEVVADGFVQRVERERQTVHAR